MMTATKTNGTKINYNIKLLAGNNVVMVEANGYETEIFVPHIAKGRIGFLNVIPNRRCCQVNSTNNNGQGNNVNGQNGNEANKLPTSEATKNWRMTAGQDNSPKVTSSSAGQTRQRNATALALSKPLQINSDSISKSVDHSKQLYKIIRGADTTRKAENYTPTHSLFPHSTFQDKSMNRISSLSANYKLAKTTQPSIHTRNNTNDISEVKWRKATMPSPSSSHRDNTALLVQRKPPVIRKLHSLTAIPSYIYSPTVPIKVQNKSDNRKRKLQSDKKTSSNTSKSLKSHPGKVSSGLKPKSKSKKLNISNKGQSNKCNLHNPSLDLIQNANCMHHKANYEFRKGCIANDSSTTQKFKSICPSSAIERNSNVDTAYVCSTSDHLKKLANKNCLAMHNPRMAYRATVL